jgi:catechol 2,3-dioxygenase-like lactoylglutathione lyase family enzyme
MTGYRSRAHLRVEHDMSRMIDHIVLATTDLNAQAAFYERLGFQVGPLNRHPWGTVNRIVQLQDGFLELISTGQDFRPPHDLPATQYSFAGFIQRFLQTGQGAAMLALATQNASADQRVFHASAIGEFETFHFERRTRKPDGADGQVAFTLAFASSPLMPAIGFFTCQHHHPENFWIETMQRHENGATHVSALVLVAENPADHAEFLSHLTGVRDFKSSSLGISLPLEGEPSASIDVLTPLAFGQRYGDRSLPADAGQTPRIAAIRIAGCDLDALAKRLRSEAIDFDCMGDVLIVPQSAAFGVALLFL